MRYLKLYEEFINKETDVLEEPEVELSGTTVDDVLRDDFFDKENKEDSKTYIDSMGVIHVKNWTKY